MKNDFFSSKPKQITESAINIAEKIFGSIEDKSLAYFGSNEIAYSVSQGFFDHGLKNIVHYKKNSSDKSSNSFKKKHFDLADISEYLVFFDIIITGVKAEDLVIKKNNILKSLKNRKHKPIFLIDANIPGNIESDLLEVDNCFLFNLNDLEQFFSERNKKKYQNRFPTNRNFEEKLENLILEVSTSLKLQSEQIFLFEEKVKKYVKGRDYHDNERLVLLDFLQSLTHK